MMGAGRRGSAPPKAAESSGGGRLARWAPRAWAAVLLCAAAFSLAGGARGQEAAPPFAVEPAAPLATQPPTEPPETAGPGALVPTLYASRPLGGVQLEVIAALVHGRSGGQLPLAVLAAPWRVVPGSAGSAVEVALLVETDLSSLLSQDPVPPLELEAYVYALDGEGALRAHLARGFTLNGQHLPAGGGTGLKVVGRLRLPPGQCSLRVLLREVASGALGLHVSTLEVPAPGASEGLRSPLLVPEPSRAWTWVLATDAGEPYPFTAGGSPLFPSARPVLRAGEPLRGLLRRAGGAAGRGRQGRAEGEASFHLLAADDRRVADVPATLTAERAEEGVSLTVAELEPPALPRGLYHLAGPTGGPPLQVVAAGAGAPTVSGRPAWTLPGATALQASVEEEARGRARRRRTPSFPLADYRSRYREALTLLAAGAGQAARTAVAGFEVEAAQGLPDGILDALLAAELEVDAELLEAEPTTLGPLLLLHLDLLGDCRSRGDGPLASHHQEMALALVDLALAARASGDGGPPPEAGLATLSSLAVTFYRRGLFQGARQAFEKVLALDEDHAGALLGLAFLAELFGDYDEAIQWLNRLLAAEPRHREGRLRLAVNRARGGQTRRAERMLARLAANPAGDWIDALAASELARLQAAGGRLAAAVATLERALHRGGPYGRAVTIQLAHLLERQGEAAQARQLLRGLAAAGRPGPSPRLLYGRPPGEILATAQATLEEQAALGLAPLAAALDGVEDAGGGSGRRSRGGG